MWTIGTALKFWMKLRGHKPGMVRQLYDLDQAIIGGTATDYHTMCLHALAIFIIELVAMAMTLKDNRFAIGLVGFVPGVRQQTQLPRRMVPPLSATVRCVFIRSMTG